MMVTETKMAPRAAVLRMVGAFAVIGLAWLAFQDAVLGITRQDNPNVALKFSGRDPIALAARVDQVFVAATSMASVTETRKDVLASLRGQALNSRALRQLGFILEAEGQIANARTLVNLSSRVSRRDAGSQIWLIEEAVARGDANAALKHFDTALRTTPTALPALLPILVSATEERSLIQPLARIVSSGPNWRFAFFTDLIEKGPSAANIIVLYDYLKGTPGAFNHDSVRALIGRLVREKRFAEAANIYADATPHAVVGRINNPSFQTGGDLNPFDWDFTEEEGFGGARLQHAANRPSDYVLYYEISPNARGEIARQLLVLPAGRYRIQATRYRDQGASLGSVSWHIQCADGDDTVLAFALERTSPTTEFTVPQANCRSQWIMLQARSAGSSASGWIDDVRLENLVAAAN